MTTSDEIQRLREIVSVGDARVLGLTQRQAYVQIGEKKCFIVCNEIDPECECAKTGEGELRIMRSSQEKHQLPVVE